MSANISVFREMCQPCGFSNNCCDFALKGFESHSLRSKSPVFTGSLFFVMHFVMHFTQFNFAFWLFIID